MYLDRLSAMKRVMIVRTARQLLMITLSCCCLPLHAPSGATTPPPSSSAYSNTQEEGMLCLERLAAGSYLGLASHPDGSGRAFLSTEDGKVWLASVPARGSGAAPRVDDSPFLYLSDRVVRHDPALGLGLVGVAFHPRFATNGRFFVSYTREKCCSTAARQNGRSRPCHCHLVVAEFSAAAGGNDYSKAARAVPSEVRKIFTMGLPQPHSPRQQHGGGQILFHFQPTNGDGYLYLVTGHGEDEGVQDGGHVAYLSQNERSFLGKIIRFDVDRSTPKPEILAMGLSNPRGCSFDTERPSYIYCANVDQQQYEQVYLISVNSGAHGSSSPKTVPNAIIDHGLPAAGRAPSIIGGLVYRGSKDPWFKARYLYMYGSAAWAAVETPASSGRYPAARILKVRCSAGGTPTPCRGGRVLSLGEDNNKDAFVIATGGVFRVIASRLCGAPGDLPPPPQPREPPAHDGLAWVLSSGALALFFAFYLIWSTMFAGGRQIVVGNCSGCCAINMSNDGSPEASL